jgi:hypothetical protein
MDFQKTCKFPGHLAAFALGGIMYVVTLVHFLGEVL